MNWLITGGCGFITGLYRTRQEAIADVREYVAVLMWPTLAPVSLPVIENFTTSAIQRMREILSYSI